METSAHSTASLREQDLARIWHPFTQAHTEHPSIPIVRAQGVYLYDEKGKRYLDAISSWWVNLHGHTHPYIVSKIHAQAQQMEHTMFAGFTHIPAIELASRLTLLLPNGLSRVFYSDNGSTAVEAALKIALQYWSNKNPKTTRKKILCFKNSYHGDTFGAMSAAGRNAFNRPFWNYLFPVESIDPPFPGKEEESLTQLKSLLSQENVACFIFEPLILGAGGMQIYAAEGINPLLKLCREKEVLLIADEVMTGFGRTGTVFACEQLEYPPDLICLSKGLTGGFLPLGATICTETIFQAFLGEDLNCAFLHGHSYTANPLACVSALASLDLLQKEESYLQRKRIEKSHRQFCQRWNHHPQLKRCEHLGTILALEYQVPQASYFHSMRQSLYTFFLDHGILLRPLGNTLYILPPYCIEEEQLQFLYDHITLTWKGVL